MSSDTYYWDSDCLNARDDPSQTPTNADVDGIAVGVANVVISICLRIQITWSRENIDEGVQASLLQTHPILLSTLLSINRRQLSLFDASYALLISSSPLTIYLVFASISNLCGINTGLYKRIKSYPFLTSVLAASILPMWFAISLVLRLSDSAFIDSGLCKGSTFVDWLMDFAVFLFYGRQPGPTVPLSLTLFLAPLMLILMRTSRNVIAEARHRSNKKAVVWRRFYLPWLAVACAWRTVDRGHKWYIYFVFAYLDADWALQVISYTITAAEGAYVLSFGQILSVIAAVPPVLSTARFIYSHRLDLLCFVRRLPRSIKAEAMYLLMGRKPDTHTQDHSFATRMSLPLPVSQEGLPESHPRESLQHDDPANDPPSVNLTAVCELPGEQTVNEPTQSTAMSGVTSRGAASLTARRSQTIW